ncbi:ATP-grasp domain-containing protein [Kitasatospora sp. NPDC049258]|uniref:ATP-grasp domain-containing protein n=1 Tax=Kitasatospora sp. NPDC049258 TaxID=3155394 RepID=UPI003419BCCE
MEPNDPVNDPANVPVNDPANVPVILLIDPADSRNGHHYEAAIRDLGFAVLPLSTGLPAVAGGQSDLDDGRSLRAGDVADAVRQVRATGLDVRAVVPANGTSLHVADEIAAGLGLPGNDPALGWARRNKAAMRVRAARTGVRVPEFRLVHSLDEVPQAAREIGFPVIVKQTMGSGSFGVSVVADEAALDGATEALTVDRNDQPMTEWLVERYVRGREYAVNFYSADGEHRMVDIWEYRQPDDRDYDFPLWDIIQIGADHPDHARVEGFVKQLLDAFGIRLGPSHIEVKCGDDGDEVYLIELAARFSGGPAVEMWARHSDLRPFHEAVECYLGRRPHVIDGDHGFRAVLGSVVVRNDDAPGTLVAVHGLEELAALPGVADLLVEFRPGDHVPITNHNMCIPVSASVYGPDRATVLRTLTLAREAVALEIAPDPADRTTVAPGALAGG